MKARGLVLTGGRGKGAQMLIAQQQQREGMESSSADRFGMYRGKGGKGDAYFCKLIGNCEENIFVQKLVPVADAEDKTLFFLERGNALRRVKYCDVDTRGLEVNEEFGDRLRVVAKNRIARKFLTMCGSSCDGQEDEEDNESVVSLDNSTVVDGASGVSGISAASEGSSVFQHLTTGEKGADNTPDTTTADLMRRYKNATERECADTSSQQEQEQEQQLQGPPEQMHQHQNTPQPSPSVSKSTNPPPPARPRARAATSGVSQTVASDSLQGRPCRRLTGRELNLAQSYGNDSPLTCTTRNPSVPSSISSTGSGSERRPSSCQRPPLAPVNRTRTPSPTSGGIFGGGPLTNGCLGSVKHVFAPALLGQCPQGPGVSRAQPGLQPTGLSRHAHVPPVGALDSPAASSPALSVSSAPSSSGGGGSSSGRSSGSRARPRHPFPGLDLGSVLWQSHGQGYSLGSSSGRSGSKSRNGCSSSGSVERGGHGSGLANLSYAYADEVPTSSDRSAATDVAEVSFELDDHSNDTAKQEDEVLRDGGEGVEDGVGCVQGAMASDSDSDASQWSEEEVVVFSLENRQGSRLTRKRCKDSLNALPCSSSSALSSSSSPSSGVWVGSRHRQVSPGDSLDPATSEDEDEDDAEGDAVRPTKRSRVWLQQKDGTGNSPDSLQSLSLDAKLEGGR